VLLYVVIAALVVIALAVALPLLRRTSVLDEVERFHSARSLTTAWSSQPSSQVRIPAEGEQVD
jgi:hypothetical protein